MTTASNTISNERSETADMEDKVIDRLKELLDSEIEHVRSEYERPGWTRWALLGGIASIVWLITNRIEQGTFNPTNVSILFLAFSLALYVLLYLSTLCESAQPDPSTEGRFRLTNRWFALSRASLLLFLAHIISVIVIAHSVQDQVRWPFTATVYVVYGLLALMLIAFFVLTYFPYPLPLSQANPTAFIVINLVLIVGSLIPSAAYLYHAARSPTAATTDDYRIAALIVVGYYLLRILAGLRDQTPILSSLVTTRRELLLGKMDVTTATQQIDVALAGLQVSDVLHEDVRGLLELWRAFGAEMNQASKNFKAIQATIKNIAESGEETTEHDVSIIESLAESIQTHMAKGHAIYKEVDQQLQRFQRRVMLLAGSSKEARAAIGKVLDQINEAAKEGHLRFEEFAKEFAEGSEAVMTLAKDALGAPVGEGNNG
jgi:hypothetical protein